MSVGLDESPPRTLLCVDDEANILASLKRMFRPHGYRVFTAGGGVEGLEVLGREAVDLVISDMRMPGMDGAQFLEQVRERHPGAVRILLTGYADVESTIASINKGAIARYIQKPWSEPEVLLAVSQALERQALQREKERLEALTRAQNDELRDLNASLEGKVDKRTRQLRDAVECVAKTNEQLKLSFLASVKAFSGLIELREGDNGRARRVADIAHRAATALGLEAEEAQHAMLAAMLQNIGRIGLPDALAAKPRGRMTGEELCAIRKHQARSEAALMPVTALHAPLALIQAAREDFDGSGPARLSGLAIPVGARILAVAGDLDALMRGAVTGKPMPALDARAFVRNRAGHRYDPAAVDAVFRVLDEREGPRRATRPEREIAAADLTAGMVLSRDLETSEGVLLLSAGHCLDAALIRQIRDFERAAEGQRLSIHVLVGG